MVSHLFEFACSICVWECSVLHSTTWSCINTHYFWTIKGWQFISVKNWLLSILFYILYSITGYGITTSFGNLSVKLRPQLQKPHQSGWKNNWLAAPSFLEEAVRKLGLKITCDPNHILHKEYEPVLSIRADGIMALIGRNVQYSCIGHLCNIWI